MRSLKKGIVSLALVAGILASSTTIDAKEWQFRSSKAIGEKNITLRIDRTHDHLSNSNCIFEVTTTYPFDRITIKNMSCADESRNRYSLGAPITVYDKKHLKEIRSVHVYVKNLYASFDLSDSKFGTFSAGLPCYFN